MENNRYKIYPDCNFMVEKYYGIVVSKDIIELKLKSMQDPDYNNTYSVLMDFRCTKVIRESMDVHRYMNDLKQHPGLVGERYVALLADKPDLVVIAALFEVFNKELPIKTKVFATTQAAIQWLGSLNTKMKHCIGKHQTLLNFIEENSNKN